MGSGTILSDAEGLILTVKKLCEKYTAKESSSVTYEKAQQLMEAVLYCLAEGQEAGAADWQAKGAPDFQNAEGVLKPKALSREAEPITWEDYEAGYRLVLAKVYKAKEIYERITENFDGYGCRNYEDTILKGLPQFFVWYDARINPQNHILTLDYPLPASAHRRMVDLCGIDRIYEYLKEIEREKNFLGLFEREEIIDLLSSLCPEYESLFLDNIYEAVLRQKPVIV